MDYKNREINLNMTGFDVITKTDAVKALTKNKYVKAFCCNFLKSYRLFFLPLLKAFD